MCVLFWPRPAGPDLVVLVINALVSGPATPERTHQQFRSKRHCREPPHTHTPTHTHTHTLTHFSGPPGVVYDEFSPTCTSVNNDDDDGGGDGDEGWSSLTLGNPE